MQNSLPNRIVINLTSNMNKKYSFQSNNEPSDNLLSLLMKDVLKDVKKRANIAAKKFEILQKKQIKESRKLMNF